MILDQIWDRMKDLRNKKCNADLEYNGHLYHVDSVSLNDLTLAAQSYQMTGRTEPMRWVTADDIDVQLTGSDFVQILQAYANRRAEQVYWSNDQWRVYTEFTMDALVAVLDGLDQQLLEFYTEEI